MRTRHPKFTRGSLAVAAIALAMIAGACAPTTPGGDPAWYGFALDGWSPVASYSVESLTSSQGLATVNPSSGPAYTVYDNFGSIPQSRVDAGWPHVGDPDSRTGYVVYPYQAATSSLGKLYEVVTPAGQHSSCGRTPSSIRRRLQRAEPFRSSEPSISPPRSATSRGARSPRRPG